MDPLFSETLTGIAALLLDLATWVRWLIVIGILIAGAAFIRRAITGGGDD